MLILFGDIQLWTSYVNIFTSNDEIWPQKSNTLHNWTLLSVLSYFYLKKLVKCLATYISPHTLLPLKAARASFRADYNLIGHQIHSRELGFTNQAHFMTALVELMSQ